MAWLRNRYQAGSQRALPRSVLCGWLLAMAACAPPATAALIAFDEALSSNGYLTISVTVYAAESEDVAALQFDVRFDASRFALVEVQTGPAAADAGKHALYSDAFSDGTRVMVTGLNQAVISDGEVARIVLVSLDGGAAVDTFGLEAPVVSDPFGNRLEAELGDPLDVGDDLQAPTSKNLEEDAAATDPAPSADSSSNPSSGLDDSADTSTAAEPAFYGGSAASPADDPPTVAAADPLTAAIVDRLVGYHDKPARPYWPSRSEAAPASGPRVARSTSHSATSQSRRAGSTDTPPEHDTDAWEGVGAGDQMLVAAVASGAVRRASAGPELSASGRPSTPIRQAPRSSRGLWPLAAGALALAALLAARRFVLAGPNRTR